MAAPHDQLLIQAVTPPAAPKYCSSATSSIHSTTLPSSASWMAMRVMAVRTFPVK